MGQYYITTSKGITYELDATTAMGYGLQGQTTDSPIESGESISDHYVHSPSIVNFTGIISDMKSLGSSNNKTTKEFIEGLIALKNSKVPFSITISETLTRINNCVFTSLNITNNEDNGIYVGVGGVTTSSYQINFSAKQIRIAKSARITRVPQPDLKDYYEPPAVESKTTKNTEFTPNILNRKSKGLI